MSKKFVLSVITFITAMMIGFVAPLQAALETQLLVDVSPSSDNSPYNQTHWYGFTALASKGYCAILKPSTGNPNLYLFDKDFNLRTSSKSTGLTADKAWYGDSVGGVFHLGAHGAASPSSTYTIQVTTAPYAKTISPTSGGAATLVTITGYGFGATQGTNYVNFGSVKATSYYSWTNTQIKVYVPSGVASGTLQVVVYVTSKVSNALNFTGISNSSDGTMWKYDLGRTGNFPNGPTTLPLSLKWKYAAQGSFTPVVANNILYVDNYDSNTFTGKLDALDANTGVLKWSYSFGANGGIVFAPVAVASGKVFVPSNNTLLCLDANTGALKWKYSITLVPGESSASSSPVVFNNIVYFTAYKTLYALDANTGALKWTYVATSEIIGSVAIFNGVVYFGDYYGSMTTSGKIYAINASNGSIKWTYTLSEQSINVTPVVANGVLYITLIGKGWNQNYGFLALDANTGALKWKNYDAAFTANVLSTPALGNGLVFAGGAAGSLFALDANTGVIKWSHAAIGGQNPIISGTLLYYNKYIFDTSTGSSKWVFPINFQGGVYAEPVVNNGKVYFNSISDGYLYCFGQ
jgi:outer membrane protein assembly factor BamB